MREVRIFFLHHIIFLSPKYRSNLAAFPIVCAHNIHLPKLFFGIVWQIHFFFVLLYSESSLPTCGRMGLSGVKSFLDGMPTEVSEPLILLVWRKSTSSRRLTDGSHKGRLQTLVFYHWKSGKFSKEVLGDNAAKRPRGWFIHSHLHYFRIYV